MKKYAYMIMAHNEWGILKKQFLLLDDKRNDIFLHIDKKSIAPDLSEIKGWLKEAKLYFLKKEKISWGGDSQIRCEIKLLEKIVEIGKEETYSYIHFISGVDMPIKTQDEIHQQLNDNNKINYITVWEATETRKYRIDRFYFFQNKIGRGINAWYYYLYRELDKFSMKLQEILKIHRVKNEEKIYTGANWFSIRFELAKYIIQKKAWLIKKFRWSICADELFLQMLVMDSPFRDSVSGRCLTLTDWNRGNPYVWEKQDFEYIMNSDCIFARKFSEKSDREIVERIFEKIKK